METASNRFRPPGSRVESGSPTQAPQHPRPVRGFLATLPLAALTLYILWGVATQLGKEAKVRPTYDVDSVVLAGLLIYVAVHVLGNAMVAAWLAKRQRCRLLPFSVATSVTSIAIATLVVPAWVVFVEPAAFGFTDCADLRCKLLCPSFAALFALVMAIVPGIPTSLLWYAFGRPKRSPARRDAAVSA